ncbi:membrane protein [Desulfuromonas versatilis]|uniref:Membrane protein n=1 Tax=Desulfuromonas versatilis TaxID=2802975 RepID=A0ABN6DWF6_9BACT|nr:AzlD domain-containing protein [Desulfuromonas versatilis]BCR04326.1 membrane protein [Desulfuromonas versatilis]
MRLDSSTLWLTMAGIGAGTFLIRFSFIWLLGRGQVRPAVQRVLRFVPASVLSALILPSFVLPQHAAFSLGNERMWAGLIAAIVAWRTRNVLLTIGAGMAALWVLTNA